MSDKTIKGQQYVATIGGQEFCFIIDNEQLERFLNSITPNDRFTPFNNLLVKTVDKDQRDTLVALISDDILLTAKLYENFSQVLVSKVEIEVKKL